MPCNNGKESQLNRSQPSLVHMYVVRGILGNRLQVFAPDAGAYLQPFLTALDSNQPHPGITLRASTSYEEVVERRGAELIIRLASNIQYQKDILQVISRIENIDFFNYDQSFVDQAKSIVQFMFGPSSDLSNDNLTTSINQSKMIITKQTCEEALHLFIDVLMPQHFILMDYRVSIDAPETPSQLSLQTDILTLPYCMFYKSTVNGNQGVLKNIHKDELEYLLNRLTRRGLLKKGKFLKSLNQKCTYDSYLKYLPMDTSEQEKLILELKKNRLDLEYYQSINKSSSLSPHGTVITNEGIRALQKQNIHFMPINNDQQLHLTSMDTNLASGEHNLTMGSQIVVEQIAVLNDSNETQNDLNSNQDHTNSNTKTTQSQSTLNDESISYGPHLEQEPILGELSQNEVLESQLVNETDLNETGLQNMSYHKFKSSVMNTSTPNQSNESLINENKNPLPLSNESMSSSEQVTLDFDITEALKHPEKIPDRVLTKCQQILLSKSPVITKTCWNRRFGGDVKLCSSAVKLLMAAGLLQEGTFAVSSSNPYVCWMKKLPSDPNNNADTLQFQQKKLNIFKITWQAYALSFKEAAFGTGSKTMFVSTEGAEILRRKPYVDVGYILNESIVSTKKTKRTTVTEKMNQAIDASFNSTEPSDLQNSNDLTNPTLITAIGDDSSKNLHDTDLHFDTGSTLSPTVHTSAPSANSSSIELGVGLLSFQENSITDAMPMKSATPKRPRKNYSPIRTRSKSRRTK